MVRWTEVFLEGLADDAADVRVAADMLESCRIWLEGTIGRVDEREGSASKVRASHSANFRMPKASTSESAGQARRD